MGDKAAETIIARNGLEESLRDWKAFRYEMDNWDETTLHTNLLQIAQAAIEALSSAGLVTLGTALTAEQAQLVIDAVDWKVDAPDGELDPDDIVSIFQAGLIAIHKAMLSEGEGG